MRSSESPIIAHPRLRRSLRLLDAVVGVGVLVSVAFLVWRTPLPGGPDLIPGDHWVDAVFVVIGGGVIALLWRRGGGRAPGIGARGAAYLVAATLGGMALARLGLQRFERGAKHPLAAAAPMTIRDAGLEPGDAAEWALRVALHVGIDTSGAGAILPIPDDWPLPAGTQLGLQPRTGGGWEIWAQETGATGRASCHASVGIEHTRATERDLTPACDTTAAVPAAVVLTAPRRRAPDTAVAVSGAVATTWLQYRGDAQRTASIVAQPASLRGWVTATHTSVRASASAVGEMILVGGHGTGLLVALDRATGAERWSVWLPNWIHQDAVSDGRLVIVGFGDNLRSFIGRAPSGVAALDLATGRRVWTVFEPQSVMTSPTILDTLVVYAAADGIVRKRSLATGRLLGSVALPGEVVMGPPVRVADTLIATLDGDHVCAVGIALMKKLWCRELEDLRMMGHASGAIAEGTVVVSGVATAVTPDIATLRALPWRLQAEMLRTFLFPAYHDYHVADFAGQVLAGLDLRTGAVRWRSPLYARVRRVDGHTSGTAAIQGGVGVVVLPLADTVVAFDVVGGAVRWTAHANQARGAPLVFSDQVIVAGRNGVIEMRGLQDGALRCTIRRSVGYDRAGPIVSGGLVILANLDGEVEAIPAASVLGCTAPGAQLPPTAFAR